VNRFFEERGPWLFGLVIVLCAIFGNGCAAIRPKPVSRFQPLDIAKIHSVTFRNCKIVERRDAENACECPRITWIRDAKTRGWIAVCGERP
jgi:hypothetical protein